MMLRMKFYQQDAPELNEISSRGSSTNHSLLTESEGISISCPFCNQDMPTVLCVDFLLEMAEGYTSTLLESEPAWDEPHSWTPPLYGQETGKGKTETRLTTSPF